MILRLYDNCRVGSYQRQCIIKSKKIGQKRLKKYYKLNTIVFNNTTFYLYVITLFWCNLTINWMLYTILECLSVTCWSNGRRVSDVNLENVCGTAVGYGLSGQRAPESWTLSSVLPTVAVGTTCLWVFITPGGGGCSAASAARGELSDHHCPRHMIGVGR